jgi:AraC family transcriptional regulator of adaptative response/methylated-DNA-[protein]-cysteine methyltransferase
MNTSTNHVENSRPDRPVRPVRNEADELWRKVLSRDVSADGSFFFAVRTTGVYCKPSCPARRPKRESVTFFKTAAEAQSAGFRPCRRCRPTEKNAATVLVAQAAALLASSNGESPSLAELAARAGSSPAKLRRAFLKVTGMVPRDFAGTARLDEFKRRLRSGSNVTNAIYDSGYGSSSRLYERSNAGLGMTPATYQRGGQGMELGYAIVNSSAGKMLVAATRRGVSAVYLGESEANLLTELKKEYPRATIGRAHGAFSEWVNEIAARADGQAARFDVPLDLQATAFQRRVWNELQRIPRGATRTYTEVAKALGRPRAFRAVARACATNPVSIVVPCHRVVRRDGSLAGYRWGLFRKERLIGRERESVKSNPTIVGRLSRAASRA